MSIRSFVLALSLSSLVLTGCGAAPKANVETPQEEQGFKFEQSTGENGAVTVAVKRGEDTLGRLRLPEGEWKVSIYKKQSRYTFFGASPSGMGGYIEFGGPMVLARYDSVTEDFSSKDLSRSEYPGTVAGISDDGETVVYTIVNESGVKLVVAKDLFDANAEAPIYEVPGEFSQAGDVNFNAEGTAFTYATANGPDDAKTALFMIDLNTGDQKELARRQITEKEGVYKVTGWKDGMPQYQ